MGYPYDKTYLEQIQENKKECQAIINGYYLLRRKFINEHEEYSDDIDLDLKENFALLGEAFELASHTLDGITDKYHFMWDVLEKLLGEY